VGIRRNFWILLLTMAHFSVLFMIVEKYLFERRRGFPNVAGSGETFPAASPSSRLTCNDRFYPSFWPIRYTPFTWSSKHRADIEQTSSRPDGTSPLVSNVGLGLAHSWSRVIGLLIATPALLISMLITIARRASWMNPFTRSSRRQADVEQTSNNHLANVKQTSSN